MPLTMDPSPNPLAIIAYVVSIPVAPALIMLAWKGTLFFAKAVTKLEQLDDIAKDVKELRNAQNDDAYEVSLSFTILESDVNAIQEKLQLPVRQFPDRRTGAADRRRQA